MRIVLVTLSFSLFAASVIAHADSSEACAATAHLDQVHCLDKEVSKLNTDLSEAFQAALASRPEKDQFDTRKEREQLQKSQRAWLDYKTENCTLMGGLQGGSNLWVTDFDLQCEKEEIERRIDFLKRVAANAFSG